MTTMQFTKSGITYEKVKGRPWKRRTKKKTIKDLKEIIYRGVSSNAIIEAGDAQIEVLEAFHDITISALRKELGKVQEKYADVCVNIHRAGRTVKDRYKLNPEKFIDKQKEFYRANKDKVLRKLALKSIKKRGLPCTDRVREKYNITQAEIDDCIKR
ncbi:unnamed protein product [Bathycoccus prasinos]